VGERVINIGEVREHAEDVGEVLAPRGDRAQVLRVYLQDIIDRELLLAEARGRGYEREDLVARRLELGLRQKVVERYITEAVLSKLDTSKEKLRERFAASKWSRVLQLAQIAVDSEDEALDLLVKARAGRPFEELAPGYSVEGEGWYGLGDLEGIPGAVADELFDLEKGDISGPHRIGDGYRIYKVIGAAPAPERYLVSFATSESMRESEEQWRALTIRLMKEREPRFHDDAIELLIARKPPRRLDPILLQSKEANMPLCSFEGGVITVRDFADVYNQYRLFHKVDFDPAGIVDYTRQRLAREALTYALAVEEGFGRDKDVVEWLQAKKDILLVEELRRREVVEPASVDSAGVREYYERHPRTFTEPDEFRAVEILVPTLAEAEELLARVRAGEDMQKLAVEHTIRPKHDRGRIAFRDVEGVRKTMGALYDSVRAAPIGEVGGPVELDMGYAIFRVTGRTRAHLQPFSEVEKRVEWYARRQEEDRLFKILVGDLREKYAEDVVVYEERLRVPTE